MKTLNENHQHKRTTSALDFRSTLLSREQNPPRHVATTRVLSLARACGNPFGDSSLPAPIANLAGIDCDVRRSTFDFSYPPSYQVEFSAIEASLSDPLPIFSSLPRPHFHTSCVLNVTRMCFSLLVFLRHLTTPESDCSATSLSALDNPVVAEPEPPAATRYPMRLPPRPATNRFPGPERLGGMYVHARTL